ncbi:hypothetical protein ACIQMR_36620 [Streptomyces sp. NPDC091376]|uniref:hypothetical protein n=1 Tax=Streptomyces sp. NPDC091376 TaxID=3365994 RepID=UPI0037F188B1
MYRTHLAESVHDAGWSAFVHMLEGESLHRQVLHGDRLVLADQLSGELVVERAARVGHRVKVA